MTDVRARITEALTKALRSKPATLFFSAPDHADHLTDVLLALDGIAVVELPEAHADWHGGLSAWAAGDDGGEVTIRKSDGRIGYTSVLNPCESPAAARALAAALLAAAEQAAK